MALTRTESPPANPIASMADACRSRLLSARHLGSPPRLDEITPRSVVRADSWMNEPEREVSDGTRTEDDNWSWPTAGGMKLSEVASTHAGADVEWAVAAAFFFLDDDMAMMQ